MPVARNGKQLSDGARQSFDELRTAWIAAGMPWFSKSVQPPDGRVGRNSRMPDWLGDATGAGGKGTADANRI
jgi:hypothetical protein